ncbi:MAG TPA: UPF0158 family protein [Nakamurella sp.]|nr:UPF0158 family protein [Nakamurella sp.]
MGTDRLRELRRAIHSGDPAAMVAAVEHHGLRPSLQLAGEVLLVALRADAAGASDLADRFAAALEGRGWDGDLELATALRAAMAGHDEQGLGDLAVDLDELADVLEGAPEYSGGYLDLRSGEIWPLSVADGDGWDDPLDLDLDDSERWLSVWPQGSRDGYQDMVQFAETCTDAVLAGKLDVALNGRGAFRRFKDVLFDYPDERAEWFSFSDDRRRGRARAWLAAAGYRAVFRPVSGSSGR